MCFPACILHKLKGCRKGSKEIRVILAQRMDVWESGHFDTLCISVEDQWRRGDGLRPPRQQTEEDWLGSTGRRFESMVHDGKLKAAMRMVTDRDGGCLYRPDDRDSKTGAPVIDVLRGKHPAARIPEAEHFDLYEHEPDSVGIFCFEEDVARGASGIDGASGPDGLDAQTLKYWLVNWNTR